MIIITTTLMMIRSILLVNGITLWPLINLKKRLQGGKNDWLYQG